MGAMRSFWKVFVALALMLPLGAFVAGTLVASAADDPAPATRSSSTTRAVRRPATRRPARPRPAPSSPSASPTHDQGDDHGGDGGDDDGDDDGLDEVTPTPGRLATTTATTTAATTTAATTTPVPGARTTTQARAAARKRRARQLGLTAVAATTAGTAATTVAATTTERATTGARPERSGVSVRVRITAAVALLTLLALTGAGLIVYVIEAQRIDQEISDRGRPAVRASSSSSRNSEGASYRHRAATLLDAFLEVAGTCRRHEPLVPGTTAGPQSKSRRRLHSARTCRRFRGRRVGIVDDNGTTTIDDPEDELILNAQTVADGRRDRAR